MGRSFQTNRKERHSLLSTEKECVSHLSAEKRVSISCIALAPASAGVGAPVPPRCRAPWGRGVQNASRCKAGAYVQKLRGREGWGHLCRLAAVHQNHSDLETRRLQQGRIEAQVAPRLFMGCLTELMGCLTIFHGLSNEFSWVA